MRQAVRLITIKDDKLLLMHRNKFGTEYYALVGGGVDMGETPEQALVREVAEESSIQIANARLVIIEDAGPIFGHQLIYLADYVSGDVQLSPDSEEARISALGSNLYQPLWVPLNELADCNLLPRELKKVVLEHIGGDWPVEPIMLTIHE